MRSPMATYDRFVAHQPDASAIVLALRRPAFVALVLGTTVAMTSTGRVTAALVASVALCWSFATAAQLAAAAILVGSSARRHVPMARGIDLLFIGHAPWSLWLLLLAAWSVWSPYPKPGLTTVVALGSIPAIWTAVIIYGFCRSVLNLAPRAALTRMLLHQSTTWGLAALYIAVAVQMWPRLLGSIGR